MMNRKYLSLACGLVLLSACSSSGSAPIVSSAGVATPVAPLAAEKPFDAAPLASFEQPWAMTFLPDGRLLVTGKSGLLKLFDPTTSKIGDISGVPDVALGGQGGFGDVVLHPDFANNSLVYLSYAEPGEGDTRGAAVMRARLVLNEAGAGSLADASVIWRQVPKVSGYGHYGHRIAFSSDGHLFISSSERQKFDPAQDMNSNLGKIVRLNDDGSLPADNPFADQGGVAAQVWTLGHRNLLGLAFDANGQLWNNEMGPAGGDELNRVVRGQNYGYPIVSNGNHYDGKDIPDHSTRPEFAAPAITWTPVISPSSLIFYSGDLFPEWKGNALIGGLSSKTLVRVAFEGDTAKEVARYDMGNRIREVEQAPDGSVWLLEDMGKDGKGRLLRLAPRAN